MTDLGYEPRLLLLITRHTTYWTGLQRLQKQVYNAKIEQMFKIKNKNFENIFFKGKRNLFKSTEINGSICR